MCGRYTLSVPLSNLVDAFDVAPPDFRFVPRFNIAPTQNAPVVAQDSRGRRMGLLRWGLIPSWAKDESMGSRLINARSETVAEKPSFRSAFRRRRCLVPADGFFEWKKEGGEGAKKVKTPYWIHLETREAMAFAGLWEGWVRDEETTLHTFTILTTEAVPGIREIHPRMPVIIPPGEWASWLDPHSDPAALSALLRPFDSPLLTAHPVANLVNSPSNDRPECIEAKGGGDADGPGSGSGRVPLPENPGSPSVGHGEPGEL
jgi:putative SOS response-associated peptidase YedK